MKKFIITLSVFVLPFVVSAYFIDLFISKNLRKSNSHAQKEYPTWNAILDGKLNADILVYGSSRAWVHFDSKMITDSLKLNTFNLGMDGQPFNFQYLRHILALKYNKKPKMIIHSVDVGTLQKGNMYNSDQFLPYMLWNEPLNSYLAKFDGYTFFDFNIPLLRYYGKVDAIKIAIKMVIMPGSNKIERVNGYQGQVRPWNNDLDNAKKKMKKYEVKFDKSTVTLFENYLQYCKDNDIQVVLVYAPMYIEGQHFIENKKEVIDLYKGYAKKYNIPFLDYTNDALCYDIKYYYNSNHLNKVGAELFTSKLCHQLDSLNIRPITK